LQHKIRTSTEKIIAMDTKEEANWEIPETLGSVWFGTAVGKCF